MGCWLVYSQTFPVMLNDGLRSRGKRYEGGEQECEGGNTGDQICAVVSAPGQGDESMRYTCTRNDECYHQTVADVVCSLSYAARLEGGNSESKQKGSNNCGSVARWQVNVVLSTSYVADIGLSGYSIFKRQTHVIKQPGILT